EVRTYATMTRSLLVLAARLGELGVTRVVMEATSDYWKAPFYLLEAQGFEVWLAGARDVKHLPGRPKTDKPDGGGVGKGAGGGGRARVTSGTCRVGPRPTSWMRCGCARSPSGACCAPASCRRRRSGGCGTRARYRADLVGVRTAEKQRVEKLLEDAQIKLSVVAADIFGVSGRAMLAALIAGERDPKALAQL